MKTNIKRIVSLLMIVITLSLIVPLNASAIKKKVSGSYTYIVLEGKYAEITAISSDVSLGSGGVLELPSQLDGYPVKSLGSHLYSHLGDTDISKIIIPDTVTYIEASAFTHYQTRDSDKYYVKEIVIPDSVVYIGACAFEDNRYLTKINIPDSVSYLGYKAFANCYRLTEVKIPGTIREMEKSVFYGCKGLKKVTFGEGITIIPTSTFENCTALTTVKLPNCEDFSICNRAFYNCKSLKSITLPERTEVSDKAFYNCKNLLKVVIKNSATFAQKSVGYYKTKNGKEKVNTNIKFKVIEDGIKYIYSYPNYYNKNEIDEYDYAIANKMNKIFVMNNNSSTDLNIRLGKHNKFSVKLRVSDNDVVKWTSSKKKVATVNNNGKLTAVGKGTTTIKATLKDGTTYKRKIIVTK